MKGCDLGTSPQAWDEYSAHNEYKWRWRSLSFGWEDKQNVMF